MDAEINNLPSTLQQYLGFTTTRKGFDPGHNFLTFPLVHSAPCVLAPHADVLRLVMRSSPQTSAQRTSHIRSLAFSQS